MEFIKSENGEKKIYSKSKQNHKILETKISPTTFCTYLHIAVAISCVFILMK